MPTQTRSVVETMKNILQSRVFFFVVATACFFVFGSRAWLATRSDVWAYVDAGSRVLIGISPYKIDPTPFKYSPPVAYLFIPFCFFSLKVAEIAFFLTSYVVGIIPYLKARKLIGIIPTYALFLVLWRFHNYDFMNLQINHWILGFLLLAWSTRKSSPWISAFSWGIAAHFKLSPLMLMIVPFMYRDWKMLFRISMAFVAIGLIPQFLHPEGLTLYPKWFALMHATTPWPASLDPILQSIPTFLWIRLHDVIAPEKFQLLNLGLLGAFCLYVAWKTHVNKNTETGEASSYAALLVATALFSPLAWKHAYLLCFPAYFLLLKTQRYKVFTACFVMMTIIPSLLRAINPPLSDLSFFTVFGAVFLAVKVLDTRPALTSHPHTSQA